MKSRSFLVLSLLNRGLTGADRELLYLLFLILYFSFIHIPSTNGYAYLIFIKIRCMAIS